MHFIKKLYFPLAGWFKNPKFELRHNVVIGAIIIALGQIIGVLIAPEEVWLALTGVGTLLAAVTALFYPPLTRHLRRPIIELRPPEYAPRDYLRYGRDIVNKTPFFAVDIQILNTGKSTGRRCRPLLTAMGRKKQGIWEKEPNWVPIGLDWILDELIRAAKGRPTEEKDLVPCTPYIFSVGYLKKQDPTNFHLAKYLIPTGQSEKFGSGEYCFEITASGEQVEPIAKYFFVEWDGEFPDNIEEARKKLRVSASDYSPW